MFPPEITILSKKLKLVETPNQFRKEDGTRRLDLEYWVASILDDSESEGLPPVGGTEGGWGVLIQYTLTAKTDTRWLVAMVEAGRVYLTSDTHLLTMAVAKTLKPSKQ